jgi:hypothetical protein
MEPSWSMKQTPNAYAEARVESIRRNNARLNGQLPTVPRRGRCV